MLLNSYIMQCKFVYLHLAVLKFFHIATSISSSEYEYILYSKTHWAHRLVSTSSLSVVCCMKPVLLLMLVHIIDVRTIYYMFRWQTICRQCPVPVGQLLISRHAAFLIVYVENNYAAISGNYFNWQRSCGP